MRLVPSTLVTLAILVFAGCVGATPAKVSSSSPATTAPSATVTNEKGSIEGLVVNEESGPIQGADVGLQEPSMKATTDAAGKFTFNDLSPGDYKLFASRLGYTSTAKSVSVAAGEVAKVQLQLATLAIANQSYYTMIPYEGYMSCSMSAFSPVNCGGSTGTDKTSWIVDVPQAGLKEAVIELVWQQATAGTGDHMEIEFCDDLTDRDVLCAQDQAGGWYEYNSGPSPVVLRSTDVPKEAKQLLLGAGAEFESPPVVQQKFTEYLTWCFVDKCAEDYSAVPKG